MTDSSPARSRPADTDRDSKRWLATPRARALGVIFVAALIGQNSIALPYVRRHGLRSAKDFFSGEVWTASTPSRFAMVDLTFVVIGFHTWAFAEARRLRILNWWLASVVLTFSVGIASAIPFFLLAVERRVHS
ncbi:hypothetical protein GOEFS_036_00890 [Gordonia effusa NBRC 100432]|uniref:DUF2834 domain-containing protein n=1 Tax=Gordonia effusa NBRC 100432 TaxID=1077974 RepID=H0QXU9_9ACTN|nr:DUF2834 domain-containing protein [Gordonia effusa]GAB17650.1 hypothetical protein GOEFS_036_00890 [Gordonia effusa NBRC 100432]